MKIVFIISNYNKSVINLYTEKNGFTRVSKNLVGYRAKHNFIELLK